MSIKPPEIDVSGTSFPTLYLKDGQLFYRSDLEALFTYNATLLTWVVVGPSGVYEKDQITPTGSVNGSNSTFTLPTTFAAGTLKVTRNGLMLKGGGADFTEYAAGPGFTMTNAPLTGDTLNCFYLLVPSTSIPQREVQAFTATANQTTFTLSFAYQPGTGGIEVYSSGLRQILGTDYTEADSTDIFFLTPRQVNEQVVVVNTIVTVGSGGTGNGITAGTVFPTTGLTYGSAFYRTDLQALYLYNGITWTGAGYGSFGKSDVIPTGSINGVNTTFVLQDQFTTSSLQVYRNGLALERNLDFFESQTLPGFTMTVPPNTGNVIMATYLLANNVNAPTRQVQAFTATTSQTLFTLTTNSYGVGTGGLEVYSGGLRQILGTDYTETSSTSFTFLSGRENGELVIAVTSGIQPNFAHGATHNTSGTDPIILTGTSFPSYPAGQHIGDLFYRSDLGALAQYNGTTWTIIQGAGDFRRENIVPTGTAGGLTWIVLDNNFVSGTMVVVRDGMVLQNGVDFFESQSLPGFTLTEFPLTNSTLLVFYHLPSVFLPTTAGEFERINIVPTGTIDGSNLTFTFTENFISGTVQVWRNGIKLQNSVDFTEQQSLPGFNVVVSPTPGSVVTANYRVTNGTTGPTVQRESIIATANQLTFALNFSYTPASGGLQVFSGGLLMSLANDYVEYNNTTVVFNIGRALNEVVSFASTGIVPNFGHGSTHKQGAADPVTHALLVVLSGSSVSVVRSNYYIIVNKTVGSATTLNLPSSAQTGDIYEIKDGKGDAATNPIYVVPASGTIDGLTQFIINGNRGAAKFVWDGTQYDVF
jgi:hypothetical protein